MGYKRKNSETELAYIYRVCKEKDVIGTWNDVANILNTELGHNWTESAYRKKIQMFDVMFDATMDEILEQDEYIQSLRREREKLHRERMKLQTEKLEYNRWLREHARDELLIEKIEAAIEGLRPLDTPPLLSPKHGNKSYCLCVGDEHYGVEFEIKDLSGNVINRYSPEIFEERMWDLLNQTIELVKKEKIDVLNVFSMGDFSDGCLRVSQLMKLRYGVVDGTIQYANFITDWLNELTKHVCVNFQMTDGNHTELRMLGQPKGTFTEDNMGKVVREFIKTRLKDNPNFRFIENPTGMIFDTLCGYSILGIHGEVKNLAAALHELSAIYDVNIKYLVAAHLHHSKHEEIGAETEVINIPSIIGVDDYSLSLRKTSNPGAKLFCFEENKGKTIEYTINLRG